MRSEAAPSHVSTADFLGQARARVRGPGAAAEPRSGAALGRGGAGAVPALPRPARWPALQVPRGGGRGLSQPRSLRGVASAAGSAMPAAGSEGEEGPAGEQPGPGTPKLCGYLQKLSGKGPLRGFRSRWFVFDPRRCYLYYFKGPQEPVPLGHLDIASACFSYHQPEAGAAAAGDEPAAFEVHSPGGAVTVLKVGPGQAGPVPAPVRGPSPVRPCPSPAVLARPRGSSAASVRACVGRKGLLRKRRGDRQYRAGPSCLLVASLSFTISCLQCSSEGKEMLLSTGWVGSLESSGQKKDFRRNLAGWGFGSLERVVVFQFWGVFF